MSSQVLDIRRKIPEYVCNVILLIVVLLLWAGMLTKAQTTKTEELCAVEGQWYLLDGEDRRRIELPAVIEAGQEVVLFMENFSRDYAGQILSWKGAAYEPQVLLGEQILYQYTDDVFPANKPMKAKVNCDVSIPTSYVGGEVLSLRLFSEDGSYELPVILAGTGEAMVREHVMEISVMLLIALVMVVLASVSLGVSLYLYRIQLRDHRFVDAAAFLLFCAVWCVTDSAVIQQHSGYPSMVRMISFYAFMLFALPMIHFVRNSGDMKKYKSLDVLIVAFYLNAIVQGILNYFGVFHMIDMLIVTHLLLGIGVSMVAAVLIKEYRQVRSAELEFIVGAFLTLAASGVLAMILYWLFEIPYYELVFEGGILLFVIILLCGLVVTMTENIRYKTELLVYQRLAKEDSLTGVANRLAFEEKLSEIQEKAETYRDVILIFFDVNGLKNVNDRFGHNAGDELIVAAARCIENVFARLGGCYRIGGDEFCVLIADPQEDPEQWFQALDQEILKYNNSGKRLLSVARGMSRLRDEEGALKRFSDWKYEADQNMYQDKGMRKR